MEIGDRVIINKPSTTSMPPFWTNEMDLFDGKEGVVEQMKVAAEYVYVYLGGISYCFNESWLTVLPDSLSEYEPDVSRLDSLFMM